MESRYFLALNYDSILYLVDPEHAPGDDYLLCEDFGFDCSEDNDLFYLHKHVPDFDEAIEILEQNGITINELEDLADSFEEDFDD